MYIAFSKATITLKNKAQLSFLFYPHRPAPVLFESPPWLLSLLVPLYQNIVGEFLLGFSIILPVIPAPFLL